MSPVSYITPAETRLDNALTERSSDMARNLDGRDALAGLDSWITREDPALHEPENDDPLGIRQLYQDREQASADMVFWQRRYDELKRQMDEASSKLGDAWERYDQAANEIARLSPDYEPRR